MLGTFHFQDPGRDAYKPKFAIDVQSPERQREIEALVEELAAFHPTKIAVEVTLNEQEWLDSLYTEYLAGRYQLGANEIFQLGFRLARRMGHSRVVAADAASRSMLDKAYVATTLKALHLDMDSAQRAIAVEPWSVRYKKLYEYDDSLKTVIPLREYFRYINTPAHIRVAHGAYSVGTFRVLGADAGYLGPDDVTQWYNRNLRIFSNLQKLAASPGDRVLLIIGAGHLPILQFVADASPDVKLRFLSEFLR